MHIHHSGKSLTDWRRCLAWAMVLACLGLAACSPRMALVRSVADELAQQGGADETDLGLARDAAAFYLKLSEGVLRQSPDHIGLAEAVAGGFVQYAYAFILLPAERLENHNAAAAQQQRERAARMLHRAREHAMAALERNQPGLRTVLAAQAGAGAVLAELPITEQARLSDQGRGGANRQFLRLSLRPELAGLAYWAAAAWGAEIALSKDEPELVADWPQAQALAEAAWCVQPDLGQGALASLMGIFEASRPGGQAAKARPFFDQALRVAGPSSRAAPLLAQAEYLAAPAGDRAAFESLVKLAWQAARGQHDLMNQVLAERAQWLLGRLDELF